MLLDLLSVSVFHRLAEDEEENIINSGAFNRDQILLRRGKSTLIVKQNGIVGVRSAHRKM